MSIDVNALKDIAKDKAIQYGKNKANETLSNQQKFQETLDKISTSDSFKKIETIWKDSDESDKEKVYKAGRQVSKNKIMKILDPLGAIETTKSIDPTLVAIQTLRYKNNKLKELKMLIPGQTFEPTMRLLVHLGLLQKPTSLTDRVLLEDMQIDFKSVDLKLIAFEAVANVVPYLKPLVPLIQLLKQYVKKLGEAGLQKVITDQTAKQEVTASPENKTDTVIKTTQTGTTVLGSNVQEKNIKDDIIKNFTIKETHQQVKNENNGTATMPKEDAIEKVAQ